MGAMSRRRHPVLSACARWVLGAWLCVALASALSPLARAGGWERLCSAAGGPLWVPAPAAGDAGPVAVHGMDCPLCLPPLAPPPAQAGPGMPPAAPGAAPLLRTARACAADMPALPPVRAPPQ